MIQASSFLKEFIRSQKSTEDFASDLKVTRQTIYNILGGENISSDMVGKLLGKTGFDFEKAFIVKED